MMEKTFKFKKTKNQDKVYCYLYDNCQTPYHIYRPNMQKIPRSDSGQIEDTSLIIESFVFREIPGCILSPFDAAYQAQVNELLSTLTILFVNTLWADWIFLEFECEDVNDLSNMIQIKTLLKI